MINPHELKRPNVLNSIDADNSSFSRFLTEKAERSASLPFGAVNNDLIKTNNAEIKLPQALIDRLKLDSFSWTVRSEDSMTYLPILYLGKLPQKSDTMSTNISDALVIIGLNRKTKFNSKNLNGDIAIPLDLQFTYIDYEQNRIVAAKYDLTNHNHRLTELNVSISLEEYLDQLKNVSELEGIRRITARIPTNINDLHKTAGLTTVGMRNALASKNGQLLHEYVLIFKFSNSSIIPENSNYYVKETEGIMTVNLKEEITKKSGLPELKISVPSRI